MPVMELVDIGGLVRREQLNNRGRFGLVRGGSNPSRHITWKDDLNNGGDAGKTCTKLATD